MKVRVVVEGMSYSYANDSRFPGPDPYAPLKDLPEFPLHSRDFEDGQRLPEDLAAPRSRAPHLAWSDLPEGTKSLTITCFDPDAPTAAGFWHWAVCNIPANVTEIGSEETIDAALTLIGDSGQRAYYGPQPPEGHGPHRYLFAVHAVDVEKLDIDANASPTVLGFQLYFHSLGRAVLWGWYEN